MRGMVVGFGVAQALDRSVGSDARATSDEVKHGMKEQPRTRCSGVRAKCRKRRVVSKTLPRAKPVSNQTLVVFDGVFTIQRVRCPSTTVATEQHDYSAGPSDVVVWKHFLTFQPLSQTGFDCYDEPIVFGMILR